MLVSIVNGLNRLEIIKGFTDMSIVINTNMSALRAQNALTKASWNLNTSLERLTTGNRINSAKDDPAGYYYASSINSQIRGTSVAYDNVSLANNMLATATGDLDSINNQIERIKDLATQYANETLTTEEKTAIKDEVQQRIDEIDRIAKESKFNKLNLLDGSKTGPVRIQIGSGSDPDTNAIFVEGVFEKADSASLNLIGGSSKFATIDDAFATASSAAEFIDVAQASADMVTQRISKAGAYESRLSSVMDSLMVQNENLNSAYSTVVEADIAEETANFVKNQLLMQTSSAMLMQANQIDGVIALQLVNSLV